VFIVHGHNNTVKQEVSRFVEKLGLEAIILHEQANAGMTIIEKIERYSNDADFALVLYTPCDFGRAIN
jgi:predicted nucleotide-binding protein